MRTLAPALLVALWLVSHPSTARADPPELQLSVSPSPSQPFLRFTLSNTSSSPLEVITDRRLLWIEQIPLPSAQDLRPRRSRARAPALGRCVHPARPLSHERSPRSTLSPGQRYSEDLSLYELCGLDLPPWLSVGREIAVHYGFPLSSRPSLLRTLVLDEQSTPVNDLRAVALAPALRPEIPSLPATPGAPTLRVSRAQGASPEDLRVTLRFTNTSVHPITLPWRSSMFRFEVLSPAGRPIECRALTRSFGPQREYFVRVPGRRALSLTVLPELYCPPGALAPTGVYDITAVFSNTLDGREYGLQRVFTGTLRSAPSRLRVTRGIGRLVPLRPELSP